MRTIVPIVAQNPAVEPTWSEAVLLLLDGGEEREHTRFIPFVVQRGP